MLRRLRSTLCAAKCGGLLMAVQTMLEPTTGKTVRMFECSCGQRAWSEHS
jgi:hypothetical protein